MPTNTFTTQNLNAVAFIDSNIGLVGGEGDSISITLQKTLDGGETWNPVNINTTHTIRSIEFVSPQFAFLTTSEPSEGFRSIDGGLNWTFVDTEIEQDGEVYFKNIDTGFVYSSLNGGDVSYTFNGGITWNHFPDSTFGNNELIQSFHFPTPNSSIGYAVSGFGYVFKTEDGGVSWSIVDRPIKDLLNDVFFLTPDLGYILGREFIFKTEDGGENWSWYNTQFGGEKFQILDSLFYILRFQKILFSNDNGLNFEPMSGTFTGLKDMFIFSQYSGYCVENGGRIYKIDPQSSLLDKTSISNDFDVYPNPSIGKFKIALDDVGINGDEYILKIFTVTNQLVYQTRITQDGNEYDLTNSNLSGFYFIQIYNNDNNLQFTKKVLFD